MTEEEVKQILKTMDLPQRRIENLDVHNTNWLLRNMFIRNGKHLMLPAVTEFLKERSKVLEAELSERMKNEEQQ